MVLEPHMELRLPQALPNQPVFSNPFAAAAPASGRWPWRRAGSHTTGLHATETQFLELGRHGFATPAGLTAEVDEYLHGSHRQRADDIRNSTRFSRRPSGGILTGFPREWHPENNWSRPGADTRAILPAVSRSAFVAAAAT